MNVFPAWAIWLIVGLIAGWLADRIFKRKKGFASWLHRGLALAGALGGGYLYQWLGIQLRLPDVRISTEALLAASCGSLLLLVILWLIRRKG